MSSPGLALVTGADQHQGLAVIRGLGRAGFGVIAAGPEPRSIGFYSRHCTERLLYTSPLTDAGRFADELLQALRRTRPRVLVPAVESTLVALDSIRDEVERYTTLAAPAADVLECAIDKAKTLAIAERIGVPIPRTVRGTALHDIMQSASSLRFPVAIKPQGHSLHRRTTHRMHFKVRYARSLRELDVMLREVEAGGPYPLVQEFARGVGVCVGAVCRSGEPLVLIAYQREREVPLTGGVSVLRRTIALDQRLAGYVTALLREFCWHGVAMVEFKYDRVEDRYTLMEVNGRFQASTALGIDAGINLPYLAVCVHLGLDPGPIPSYTVGVHERWLRGDLLALLDRLTPERRDLGLHPLPSRARALLHFLRDFRPGMKYDEFRLDDWGPGAIESAAIARELALWCRASVGRVVRKIVRSGQRRLSPAPLEVR